MDVHPTKNVSIGIDPYPYPRKSLFPHSPSAEVQMVCEGREHPESSLRVEMLQQVLEEDQASASDKGRLTHFGERKSTAQNVFISKSIYYRYSMYVYIYIYILYIYTYI